MMASSVLEQEDCPCVGSMGLHQNNIAVQNDENMSRLGLHLMNFRNRSVIDVFRNLRDRYFGKPILQTELRTETSQETNELNDIENSDFVTISSLPLCCKLMILSLLDTCDVCNVSRLNSHWREVANDQILWRELLIRDMCTWDSMTNRSHPLIPQFWDQKLLENGTATGLNFTALLHDQGLLKNNPEKNNSIKDDVKNDHMDTFSNNMDVEYCETARNGKENHKQHIHANVGINFKALYIHSSYQRQQDDFDISSSTAGIPGFIKSLWQGGVEDHGEVIMTGPGIDSPRTSSIFRSLMWGSGFLETKGLLPGNRDGIGSGVQVTFKEKISFKLIALYSGNNRVRERRFGMERLMFSNVVEAIPNHVRSADESVAEESAQSNNISPTRFELYEAVQQYFEGLAGRYRLVYVVDATANLNWEDITCNRLELEAILRGIEKVTMVAEEPSQNGQHEGANEPSNEGGQFTENLPKQNFSKRPLLVLSCVAGPDVCRIPCVQITAMLNLPAIDDRPWRVQDVTVSSMEGVEKGLEWLLRQP